MKTVTRDVYIKEFETMPYRWRLHYLWANEVSIGFPDVNLNPLRWCLLDLIKVAYVPVLYLAIVPTVGIVSLIKAHKLKSRYIGCEYYKSIFKSKCRVLK